MFAIFCLLYMIFIIFIERNINQRKVSSVNDIITFFTSRTNEHEIVTKQWLDKHGFKYHNLLLNKPRGGNYHWIDNHIVRATRYDGKWTNLTKKEHTIEVFE